MGCSGKPYAIECPKLLYLMLDCRWQPAHENQEKKHWTGAISQNNQLRSSSVLSVLDVWAGAKKMPGITGHYHSKSGLFQQDCLALEAFNSRLKDYLIDP
jgi:hypothetical protein